MSYVLEALKKAEAQKDPGARTALLQERRELRRSRGWQILIAVALLANLAVVLWLFYPGNQSGAGPVVEASAPQPAPGDAPTQQPAPASAAATVAKAEQEGPITKPETSDRVQTRPVETPASAAVPARPENPPLRVSLSDLPAAARGRFPGLAFSTHIYAEDPALRALVVNGKRLTEGDRLGVLELVEVTEDGAVFGFENFLVTVSVLDAWD